MRGKLLRECIRHLRGEIGHSTSTNVGMNVDDSLQVALERTQERLWEEWDWKHMEVTRDIEVAAGQRFYNVPPDLAYERISKAEFRWGNDWIELKHGITQRDYNVFDSDLDKRSWPVEAWDVTEDPQDTAGNIDGRGMIEVWPIPDRGTDATTLAGTLRLTGIRMLGPFTQLNHRCELDHNLIVLYAAAEFLARKKSPDAQMKLTQATQLLNRLRGNGQKIRDFKMGEPAEVPRMPASPKYVRL
jgi:hypothetical protein